MLTSLPVTLYPSKQKSAWLLLLMFMFVGLGGFLIWMDIDVIWGWISVAFFGLGAVVMALQFHPRASYLTLAEDGFTVCSLFRPQRYEWRYIEGFGTYCIAHNNYVGWNFTLDYPQRNRGLAIAQGLCGYEAGLPETYGLSAEDLSVLLNNVLALLNDRDHATAQAGFAEP